MIICLLLISASCEQLGEYQVATLDVGKGRSIEIFATNHVEVSQGILYQVKVDQNIVVSLTLMCTGLDNGKLKFKTLLAKDGDLVGVFEQKYPDEILAIHDFRSNVSWPRGSEENGAELFKQLQAEHLNMKLTLGQKHGCI